MTRTTCPDCRLRFAAAIAEALPSCPVCGGALAILAAEQSVGYRLADLAGSRADLPVAVAAALPVPAPTRGPRA